MTNEDAVVFDNDVNITETGYKSFRFTAYALLRKNDTTVTFDKKKEKTAEEIVCWCSTCSKGRG